MPIAGVRFGENHLSASAFSFTRGIYLWSHSQTYLSDINIDDILDNFSSENLAWYFILMKWNAGLYFQGKNVICTKLIGLR